jgi:hypothetical protein
MMPYLEKIIVRSEYVLGSCVFFTTLTSDFVVAARDFDYSSRSDRRLALKAFTALEFPVCMQARKRQCCNDV